jgi:hypothetical protein
VSPAAIAACRGLRELGATQSEALAYYPQIDDVAHQIDEASAAYAAMKTAQAAQDARRGLRDWWHGASSQERTACRDLHFAQRTPLGWVIVSGTGRDTHAEDGVLALVDLGGEDLYTGTAGAGGVADAALSVCIDLAGNDTYDATDPRQPAQGSGVFGTGVLIDCEGTDRYTAQNFAQGFGFFGTGILVDEAGADRYRVGTSGQGCGYFGIGPVLRRAG